MNKEKLIDAISKAGDINGKIGLALAVAMAVLEIIQKKDTLIK